MQTNQQLAKKIKELCKERKISMNKLIEDAGFSKSFIYDIEKRNSTPSIKVLQFIAGYFDVTMDYLQGNNDNANNVMLLEGVEYAFFEGYKQLDDEDKAELNRAAQRMLELKRLREGQQT